jgi:hypothetical protein
MLVLSVQLSLGSKKTERRVEVLEKGLPEEQHF